jgi:hypothetical protein
MFYVAPYIGAGTRTDPFRPLGATVPGWSAIDLRPDPSKADGYAILHLPERYTQTALSAFGDHEDEPVGPATRAMISRRLGVAALAYTHVRDIIAELLLAPGHPWKPLRTSWVGPRAQRAARIWLAGRCLATIPSIQGGVTDDFDRANETPLAGNWTAVNGTLHLISNNVQGGSEGSVNVSYYNALTPANDQYSAAVVAANGGAGNQGVTVRTSTSAASWYVFEADNGVFRIWKYVAGAFTQLTSSSGSISVADVVRIEASGSSISGLRNGSTIHGPVTDTSHASGRVGIYSSLAANKWASWEGGDLGGGGGTANPWFYYAQQ